MNDFKWESHFPDAWIVPGEYRFCGRCGNRMIEVTETLCVFCQTPPGGAAFAAGVERDSRLRRERDTLAEQRRAAGMKPLFWMEWVIFHCVLHNERGYSACLVPGADIALGTMPGPAALAEIERVRGVAASMLLPEPGERIEVALVTPPCHLARLYE